MMKLLKPLIIGLMFLPSMVGFWLWANELIRIDVRSGQVRAESLPLDFPAYPMSLVPSLQEPDVHDVQLEIKEVPQYQFLSEFAQKELEALKNEE